MADEAQAKVLAAQPDYAVKLQARESAAVQRWVKMLWSYLVMQSQHMAEQGVVTHEDAIAYEETVKDRCAPVNCAAAAAVALPSIQHRRLRAGSPPAAAPPRVGTPPASAGQLCV